MADRPEMFVPTSGLSAMADSMEPCKMLWGRPLLLWQPMPRMAHRPDTFGPTRGADHCCHGNNIWPRRGDLVAYRLVNLHCLFHHFANTRRGRSRGGACRRRHQF